MKVQFKIMDNDNVFPTHLMEEMSLETFKNILKYNPKDLLHHIERWEKKMKPEPTYDRSCNCNQPEIVI